MPLLCCDLDDTLYDRMSAFASWTAEYADAHGADDDFVAWLIAEDEDGDRDRHHRQQRRRRAVRHALAARWSRWGAP